MEIVCHGRIELESLFGKEVTGTSDGGSLLLRGLDIRHQITGLMARSLQDSRSASRVHHGLEALLKQRVYGN